MPQGLSRRNGRRNVHFEVNLATMIPAGSVRMTAGLFAPLLSASSFGQAPSQPPNQAAGHPSSCAPTPAQPQAKQEPPLVRVTTPPGQVSGIRQDKKGEPGTDPN